MKLMIPVFSKKQLLTKSINSNYPYIKPSKASINITSQCNSRCGYCDCWKNGKATTKEPSIDEIKKLYSSLKALGVNEVNLSGGEPLLRDDLEEIVTVLSKGLKVILTTNGILLTRKKIDNLVNSGLKVLNVSLDTFNAETYEFLRGVPFKFAEQAIELLAYGKKKYLKLIVSVNCVISRYNVGHLGEFSRNYFNKIPLMGGINFQAYDAVWGRNDDLVPSQEQYAILKDEIENLIAMKKMGFLITNSIENLRSIPDYFYHQKPLEKTNCSSGFTTICIDANFALHSCYALPPVADLRKENLADVWFSHKMKNQREKMVKGECPGCSCFLLRNNAFHVGIKDIAKHFLLKDRRMSKLALSRAG